eukprot:4144196-Heterocapsa_arctica.AAC.1
MHCQALVWRMQNCDCPYRDTMRMFRAFRQLPVDHKKLVFQYGLRAGEGRARCDTKPAVVYCKWHLQKDEGDKDEGLKSDGEA